MTREDAHVERLGYNHRSCGADGTIKPLCVRVEQAATMLGIGRTRIYGLIGTGEIEVIKLGRATLIPIQSLEAFVEKLRDQNRI